MRVLVINPPNEPYSSRDLLIEPIDVLTVASYIKSLGNEVKLVDMDIKQRSPETIQTELKEFKPDYTVIPFDYHIPLFRSEAIPGITKIVKLAETHNSKVIIGGRTPNHYPEQFMNGEETVVVLGEMEPAISELMKSNDWSQSFLNNIDGLIYRRDGELKRTSQRKERFDINQLPMPDRYLVDLNDYIDVRTILSSRGCVEKCGFCPVHEFWGYWKRRDASKVVDEIECLVKDHNAKKVLFLDDHATVNKKRMQEISTGILERNIETTLGCLGTVSCYDKETVKLMQQAGFRWIHYGMEMISQEVLDFMNKKITPQQMKEAIEGTKAQGLRVRTSWIFDAPKTTEQALDRTIEFILETQPQEIRAHYLALRAGTPFARQVEAQGIPQQYIHASKPHSSFETLPAEIIVEKVEKMVEELQKIGYCVVKNVDDWAKYENCSPDIKVISFCPLRYGLGWQR